MRAEASACSILMALAILQRGELFSQRATDTVWQLRNLGGVDSGRSLADMAEIG
jgi:hypothetical protein